MEVQFRIIELRMCHFISISKSELLLLLTLLGGRLTSVLVVMTHQFVLQINNKGK